MEILRQLADVGGHQMNEQALAEDERAPGASRRVAKRAAPGVRVGEVDRMKRDGARRRRRRQDARLVFEHFGLIELHPPQRWRKRKAIGTRIEAGREADDQVGASGNLPGNQAIERVGARREQPVGRVARRGRNSGGFCRAWRDDTRQGSVHAAEKRPRKRIVECGVSASALTNAMRRQQTRGGRDDQRPSVAYRGRQTRDTRCGF